MCVSVSVWRSKAGMGADGFEARKVLNQVLYAFEDQEADFTSVYTHDHGWSAQHILKEEDRIWVIDVIAIFFLLFAICIE